jgi:hypothetical protein
MKRAFLAALLCACSSAAAWVTLASPRNTRRRQKTPSDALQ